MLNLDEALGRMAEGRKAIATLFRCTIPDSAALVDARACEWTLLTPNDRNQPVQVTWTDEDLCEWTEPVQMSYGSPQFVLSHLHRGTFVIFDRQREV